MIEPSFREARAEDCRSIAEAVAASSGGYAQLGWLERRGEFPGLSLIEIGARAYAEDVAPYTWRNATVAEIAGRTAGVLLTFGIDPGYESVEPDTRSDDGQDFYAPVRMEQPHSWYICAMAVFEPWRGRGVGTRMLELCRDQARRRRYPQLSLIAFEQNAGSVRLYERNGFTVIARSPIIPHAIIEYRGDALLMSAPM